MRRRVHATIPTTLLATMFMPATVFKKVSFQLGLAQFGDLAGLLRISMQPLVFINPNRPARKLQRR